jgi:hypothetical protein
MKNLLSTLILGLLLFATTSCEDYIENPQRGTQTLDNYFQSAEECQYFVNGLYWRLAMYDDWWQLLGPRLVNEAASDDAWMGNTEQSASDYYPAAHYYITPTYMGNIPNIYRFRFENISNCNYAIDRITASPIDGSAIAGLVAQAKFCRAYNYYELVNNFGGVPLALAPLSPEEMTLPRASKEEVYAQIFADLKDAAAALSYQTAAQAQGRTSKGACQALLARSYLFSGDYENAYLYADSVIQCGMYSLEPEFINVWNVDNPNGVESIFEVQTSDASDKTLGMQMSTVTGGRGEQPDKFPSNDNADVMDGWGWCMPTSDLENCYLEENDEIRRKSTITKFNTAVYGDEVDNPTYYFNPTINKSQRVIRKYYIPVKVRRTLTDKRSNAPLNVPLIRLAEIYLTRAEAAWHTDRMAMNDLQIVRDRVNLSAKTLSEKHPLLLRAIWKERRMELAFEGLRLYDIRRQIDPATNKPVIEGLLGPNGTFVKYNTVTSVDAAETGNLGERQDKGIMFDAGKHLLWPIPQAEIDRSMGVVEQNPNY